MRITVITAFPALVEDYLNTSVLGRARERGDLEASVVDLRDFAAGDYRQVDDYAYGGGGMVLMPGPLGAALDHVGGDAALVAAPSPQGVRLHQGLVESLAREGHLVLLCGHYEGIDERVTERYVDLEFSLGDVVLTGGELPAMVLADAVARLMPGVVGRREAVEEDSFYSGFLDHPHYTRPAEWRGRQVPGVLRSGDHQAIDRWRTEQRRTRTLERRPDLLAVTGIGEHLSSRVYLALGDGFVDRRRGDGFPDVRRLCALYGVERLCLVEPSGREGLPAAGKGVDLEGIKVCKQAGRLLQWVERREKARPFVLRPGVSGGLHWLEAKRRALEADRPLVFWFGDDDRIGGTAVDLCPLQGRDAAEYAVAVALDRFLGCR